MATPGMAITMANETSSLSPSAQLITKAETFNKSASIDQLPPEAPSLPTCERLDHLIERFSSWGRPCQITTSTPAQSPPSPDRLHRLLSNLPYELRLTIYEYCVACIWHRKRRVSLDYIVDGKWMAVSPTIFAEAAPLLFSQPMLFVHTKLADEETLAGVFNQAIERAFPADCSWVSPAARSMVRKLAVTVRCLPDFFFVEHSVPRLDLSERLRKFFSAMHEFADLTMVYISIAPAWFPRVGLPFPRDWAGEVEESMLRRLRKIVSVLETVIPETCRVVWRFDKAAMPLGTIEDMNQSKERLIYLDEIHEVLGRFWSQVNSSGKKREVY